MDVLEALRARCGNYRGVGVNHEGQPFQGSLHMHPLLGARGLELNFRAVGNDGTVYHEERTTLASGPDGPLLATVNTNAPRLDVLGLREDTTHSDRRILVFGEGERADRDSFRLEIAFDLWSNGELTYRFAWGLPGGDFRDRSSVRLTPRIALSGELKFMGHRGARHEYPENTLGSIERALEAGVDAIEIDVHLSEDGEPVVIHDPSVDRTTSGSGLVAEMTVAQLKALDAGQREQIPTLHEVLELTRDVELFVEIKAPDCEAPVVRAINDVKRRDSCLVKAFNHRYVIAVKQLTPDLRTGCLMYGLPLDPVGVVRAAGADFISLNVDMLDAELVAQCHASGVAVCAWNCNEPDQVERFRAWGVDWLGTDRPTTVIPR